MDQKIEMDNVYCKACGCVYLKLKFEKDLRDRDRCRATCEACDKFIQFVPLPVSMVKMPFGKHKGKKLTEIPRDYIEWALDNMTNLNGSLKKHFESLVNR